LKAGKLNNLLKDSTVQV